MKKYILIIKDLLERKNLTNEQLAEKIGKNRNTISNYFTGKTTIDLDTLEKIAEVLNVPVSYFFEDGVKSEFEGKKIIGNNNMVVGGNGNIKNNTVPETDLLLCKQKVESLEKEIARLEKTIQAKDETIEILRERK